MSPSPRAGLEGVRERIAQACERCGRDPGGVRLVAVSKKFPADRVRELLEVGPGPVWHLVGSLQRNKARHAVGVYELIHSGDAERLAVALDRRAAAAGLRQAVLVQLNLAGESTKSGVSEAVLWPLVETVAELDHLDLRGLMTIPPPVDRAEESRPWFARLRELREEAARRLGRPLPELSMGMTDDFEVAVEEGATLVRIGRAIFGERG